MHYLKITASFLLTVHAFHLASLQDSTNAPWQTLNKEWLRAFMENRIEIQNQTEEETQYYSGSDTGVESSNDYSGTASGSMAVNDAEEENVISQRTEGNNGSDVVNITLPNTDSSSTTKLPESPSTTVTITTTGTTKQSLVNLTETEEESSDSATTTSQTTTTPKSTTSTTQESTTKPKEDIDSNSNTTTVTTTAIPMIEETTNKHTMTTTLPPDGLIPETTPAAAVNTPEQVNRTALENDDDERGFASDAQYSKTNRAWAVVLGTGLAVACVGLVAYIILKKKRQRDFSHRKLVEEFHPNPVLRLDNSEPLDLNYGGGAYYNPALQRDNIQMSNFSGHRR